MRIVATDEFIYCKNANCENTIHDSMMIQTWVNGIPLCFLCRKCFNQAAKGKMFMQNPMFPNLISLN